MANPNLLRAVQELMDDLSAQKLTSHPTKDDYLRAMREVLGQRPMVPTYDGDSGNWVLDRQAYAPAAQSTYHVLKNRTVTVEVKPNPEPAPEEVFDPTDIPNYGIF